MKHRTIHRDFRLRKFFGAKIMEKKINLPDDSQDVLALKSFCITHETVFSLRKKSDRPLKKFYAFEHFSIDELRELLYSLPSSQQKSHIVHSLQITQTEHLQHKMQSAKRWAHVFAALAAASSAVSLPVPLPLPRQLGKILGNGFGTTAEDFFRKNLIAVILDCYNISPINWEELWPTAESGNQSNAHLGDQPKNLRFLAYGLSRTAAQVIGKSAANPWAKRIAAWAPLAASAGNAGLTYSRIYRCGLALAENCEKRWLGEFTSRQFGSTAQKGTTK